MSANRANASARNKRAGGADINTNGPTQGQGQRGTQQMQPQVQPKLSVSDAIGLITLRLGRVEQIVQTIQTSPNDPTSIPESDGTIVDKQVFDNIVKRLDTLEKQKNVITSSQSMPNNSINQSGLVTIQKHDTFVKDVAKELKEMRELISKTSTSNNLTNEIAELKDMLLKLQAFTLETNNKLVNIIFNDSHQFEILESGDKNEDEGSQIIDDFNMKFFGSVSESNNGSNIIELSHEDSGLNLKELIQQEFQKDNIIEEHL